MEKNIIVLDELSNHSGTTFPKRARGLVKNGRAEYVDDHTIRMKNTHAPAILTDILNNMEDKTLSKVIDFNARDFRFDETNQGVNSGSRMFITDMFDKACEVFEIGGQGSWTQICSDKVLERETDYLFRFGIMNMNNSVFGDSTSQFILVPDDNWDDRFVFNLTNDQFKPTAIKKWNGKDFRLYEIPFNTGHIENYRFVIVEHMTSARIFPIRELEAYSSLEDSTGESSRFTKPNFDNINFDNIKVDLTEFGRNAGEAVKNAFNKFSGAFNSSEKQEKEASGNSITRFGEGIEVASLKQMLDELGDGGNLNLTGCSLNGYIDSFDWGTPLDGVCIDLEGCSVSAGAFDGIMKIVGDGSDLFLRGCRINFDGTGDGKALPSDGIDIDISGSNMSPDAFAYIARKLGDGSNLFLGGAFVNGDYTPASFGEQVDGVNVSGPHATIPDQLIERLRGKFGDGCNLT